MFATSRGLFIGLAFLALCGIAQASGPAALGAAGPAREYADKLMFFGQFVGDWEFDMTATKPDGSQVAGKGEWYFGWVLDGHALQDVWIFPGAGQSQPRGSWEYGSSVRFYDPKEDVWRLSWIGPVRTNMGNFTGRMVGDEFVFEGKDRDGDMAHWIYYDLHADHFQWRAEVSQDGGKTWKLIQHMNVRRVRS
jgi:hypothetical protein